MTPERMLFVDGAIFLSFLVAGLFFVKFWRRTHDRLFLLFALSFWIMAVNRLFLSISIQQGEHVTLNYVIRLLAFLMILFAIVDKNRSTRRASLPKP